MADSIISENWKVVSSCSTYEVSDHGRVRRRGGTYGCRQTRPLKSWVGRNGYPSVALSLGVGATYRQVSVHQLVLETFVGPPPSPEYECAHGDGNKMNNHISNLRWATHKENALDATIHGSWKPLRGEDHPSAKLSEADVIVIKKELAKGTAARSIAINFGVSKDTIVDIRVGRKWRHVKL
jgi:hypothetical protein